MKPNQFNLQPNLSDELVTLKPLRENDFEELFAVAADPLIWEQHPNKDRYKREVFLNFFEGAISSQGAFLIFNSSTGKAIGSSRFYDFDSEKRMIAIGYTFYSRGSWGSTFNHAAKKLMLDYAFQFVERVVFHIGAKNIRSQTSIQRLGAKKIGEINLAYYGETENLNFIFQIDKLDWKNRK